MNVILADNLSQSLPGQAKRGAQFPKLQLHPLRPVRQLLDRIEIRNPKVAKFIYKAIPAQCPFARDITLFGRKIAHIPPLCKLNPLYDQLVGLRFRALCYLVDQCGMDL
jgi:hypothetical protein